MYLISTEAQKNVFEPFGSKNFIFGLSESFYCNKTRFISIFIIMLPPGSIASNALVSALKWQSRVMENKFLLQQIALIN